MPEKFIGPRCHFQVTAGGRTLTACHHFADTMSTISFVESLQQLDAALQNGDCSQVANLVLESPFYSRQRNQFNEKRFRWASTVHANAKQEGAIWEPRDRRYEFLSYLLGYHLEFHPLPRYCDKPRLKVGCTWKLELPREGEGLIQVAVHSQAGPDYEPIHSLGPATLEQMHEALLAEDLLLTLAGL
jgi:hypothetical protein